MRKVWEVAPSRKISHGDKVAMGILFFNKIYMKNNICKEGNVHLIGVPKEYQAKISARALEGLDHAQRILKCDENVDVVIYGAESWEVNPKMPLYEFTVGKSNRIDFKIDFSRKNIDGIIDVELPMIMHHAVSHVVRHNVIGYSNTLLDYFVDEGVSCFVEQAMMPKRKIPYIQKHADEQMYWRKAKKILIEKITWNDSREWLIGTGKYPRWIGYRLGYLLMKEFVDKNPIDLDVLVRMKSKDILKRSGL